MKLTAASFVPLALSTLLLAAAGCQTGFSNKRIVLFPDLVHAPSAQSEAALLFGEMGGEEAFLDLARYLYRWYLDEDDLTRFSPKHKHQLWIRRVQMVGDANDNSRYLEVVFPAIGVMVTLKKTDYQISELKLKVKSDGYRVIRVCRDAADPRDYAALDIDIEGLYERLFKMRLERAFPSEALLAHVQSHIVQQGDLLAEGLRGKPKTLHFAPVHAVDNELWAFWEEGNLLFKYSSEIDLANPDAWSHDTLDVAICDLVTQTVVSFEERPGDNRFMTRDQVGRALYNCIVLGKRRVTP